MTGLYGMANQCSSSLDREPRCPLHVITPAFIAAMEPSENISILPLGGMAHIRAIRAQ